MRAPKKTAIFAKALLIFGAVLSMALLMPEIAVAFECGDTNGDEAINVSDVNWISGYLFRGYPAPYGDGDVDMCGSINISDVVYFLDYIFQGGPPPCAGTVTCYHPTGVNAIILGCPVETYGHIDDSVAIPVYLRSDVPLAGFSCALVYDSDDIVISSVDINGSVIDPTWGVFQYNAYPEFSADYGKVNLGWYYIPPSMTPIPPQDDGLLFTMWIQIPYVTPDQVVDFDTTSTFITNVDIEFILSPVGGGSIRPAYLDCGAEDLIITTPSTICGDANGDWFVDVSDAVYILNYVFLGGGAPSPLACGDANSDCNVGVSDAVWIINYVFVGGDAPRDCCIHEPGLWPDGVCGPFR